MSEKLNEKLTSFDKDSSRYFYLNPEKSLDTSSGEPSLEGKTYSSTLNVSNVYDESSPFDSSKNSSKDSFHLHPSCHEVIASSKCERWFELFYEALFFKDKTTSAYLPLETVFVQASSPIRLFEYDSELRDIESSAIVGNICKQSHRFNAPKHSYTSPYSKLSHETKLTAVSPSPVSKISLALQTQPPSSYYAHSLSVSGELKFSSTCLHNLESLLTRSPHPTPKIKEAIH